MKKFLFIYLVLMSVFLPLACSDNNNPTKPAIGSTGGTTSGGTPTQTLVTSITITNTPGGNSPTVTATVMLTPTPTFINNTGTSCGPNGFYYDGAGNLQVVESVPGIVNWTGYSINTATGALFNFQGVGGLVAVGVPTPNATPVWVAPTTITLALPQGIAYTSVGTGDNLTGAPTGWWAILDSTPSGAATLYEGGYFNNGLNTFFNSTNYTNGYDGVAFNSPRAVVADSKGYFYVADTGNGFVDMMGRGNWQNGGWINIGWIHRWDGSSSNFAFKKPVALAIDAQDNLFVGDSGYPNSEVTEYSNQGTYFAGEWTLTPGCVINGLAVDSLSPENFYVSDIQGASTTGGAIEEYQITSFNTVTLVRKWSITTGTAGGSGYHQYLPFDPSCIALIQVGLGAVAPTQIVVGDQNNSLIDVFGP